jgi:hypothetical protein
MALPAFASKSAAAVPLTAREVIGSTDGLQTSYKPHTLYFCK